MQTVKHKMFGIGEVINKEVKENGMYITVRFENGKEMRCTIPDSFTLGIMVAEGSLKEEVNTAIAEKKAREDARLQRLRTESAVITATTPSNRRGRTPTSPVTVKGSVELAFEEYLINAGYKAETDTGNPSTVFSYTNAIKKVFPGPPCRTILRILCLFMILEARSSTLAQKAIALSLMH